MAAQESGSLRNTLHSSRQDTIPPKISWDDVWRKQTPKYPNDEQPGNPLKTAVKFMLNWQLFRYASVGCVNTLVSLLVIFGTKAFLYNNDVVANVAGYAVGLAVSFVLNKSWTFDENGPNLGPGIRFLAAFLIAYSINLGTVLVCIDWLTVNPYFAHILGMVPYSAAFFFLCKFFVFSPSEQS